MTTRPISILISAMGGEGGGVLTDWIVSAAQRADLPVQGTSIPGVAQRTGATTYYVEVWPETHTSLAGRTPVFALGPGPGDVDVVIATELVEAGRCCERGFVSPDRTTLIAATRRVFATSEKSAMSDGRFDAERVMRTIREMPRRAVLFDPERLPPAARNTSLNALSLGVLAASLTLPIPHDAYRDAIRAGVAPEANLRGFEAGLALADAPPPAANEDAPPPARGLPAMLRDAALTLPPEVLAVAEIALPRLADFQSEAYAALYLDRLKSVLAADPARSMTGGGIHRLSAEVARHLALWMAYEDVVRVAQLKSSRERFAEVRAEVRAKPGEPVRITEFLKPGADEIAALLPPSLGRRLRAWGERREARGAQNASLRLPSTTITGFLTMFALARLRRFRPLGLRYTEEQEAIESWLARIRSTAKSGDHALAVEITACATLLKGYGETQRRGRAGFAMVMSVADAQTSGDPTAAGRVARAREAALADPEHKTLRATLDAIAAEAQRPALAQAAE
ncbi:indolepyruvate oxidoreductase subunit beta family protein [Roseomonas sp. CCTCC AB2023176]|uniref:indolepyruvate oxidoreductase subunit beta family protein n=1 Tax=Roseomonas sp. CCTCC AB2023176 TaxID=3342640 RepID=UPI0035DB2AFC